MRIRDIYLLCIILLGGITVANSRLRRRSGRKGPRFVNNPSIMPSKVSAVIGRKAIIPCRVRNLGTHIVYWRRTSDTAILAIRQKAFIDRITIDNKDKRTWDLIISDVVPSDEGSYECQLNTKAYRMKKIFLKVQAAPLGSSSSSIIEGSGDFGQTNKSTLQNSDTIMLNGSAYVDSGKRILLQCSIPFGGNKVPQSIKWFHDGRFVQDKVRDSRISISNHVRLNDVLSTLRIIDSKLDDAGSYTCRAKNYNPSSFKVHVLDAAKTNTKRESSQPNSQQKVEAVYAVSGNSDSNSSSSSAIISRYFWSISIYVTLLIASRLVTT